LPSSDRWKPHSGAALTSRGALRLDIDLAELYGVPVGRLNEAVKRNLDRFPTDFMLRLTSDEVKNLKSQLAISRSGWGGRRSPPHAFTEQGVAMLSSVLRSPRAVGVNIEIVRAFVRLRRLVSTHADLAKRLGELEQRYDANRPRSPDRSISVAPSPTHHRLLHLPTPGTVLLG
jgi:hypothetical protein